MIGILRGSIAALLLVLNCLFWFSFLFLFTLIKLLIPVQSVRSNISRLLNQIAHCWSSCNAGWMHLTQKMDWEVQTPQNLSKKGWYFVVCNHQSWVDILVLQYAFNRRIPLLKFFLKQELIKVPIMGIAWWALDFPFMKRYSKEYLEKHPEKKGEDFKATQASCEKFKQIPTSIMNFLEGTRFSDNKHQQQNSPFTHLLKPKAGGMAFAMNVMGDQFQSIIDVTIYYPNKTPSFWEFLKGEMPRVIVSAKEINIPSNLRSGNYQENAEYREAFQAWIYEIWQDKNTSLTELKLKNKNH